MPVTRGSRLAAALLLLLLTGCATHEGLRPFRSDGCSLFPDRAPFGDADWCQCCLAHDLAYWKGGTEDERLRADTQLRECVVAATGKPALADAMLAGVRVGGTPYLGTPFRWGFGWAYERKYQALTPDEQATAARLEREYFATRKTYVCR